MLAPSRAGRQTSSRVVLTVLASCGIAVSLMQTIVIPLLPEFPELLNTTPANATWLVTANLIAGAVCAPVLGRLGDMVGKRRMLLVALAVMVAGSALGAVSDEFVVVLIARVLQGTAMGVVPLGISVMRDELPEEKVGSGIALMSSTLGAGGAIGLPLTGVVAEHLSWHWLFGGAVALGLILMIAIWRLVPESPVRVGGRFDLVGAFGLSAALVCLLLTITQGNDWGWTSPVILGLFGASLLLFLGWGVYELWLPRRTVAGQPLVDLRVSARPQVLLTNIASVLIGFAMFASFLVSAQIFQAPTGTEYGFGMSLTQSGIALLPSGLMMIAFSPVTAGLSRRRGPRTTFLAGAAILAAANLARTAATHNLTVVVVTIAVTSIGAAFAYGAVPAMIMRAVPVSETAAANSLNALARSIGTSSCSAVVAAVTTASITRVAGVAIPTAGAYTAVFGIASLAAVIAFVIAALIPRDNRIEPHLLPEAIPPTTAMIESTNRRT